MNAELYYGILDPKLVNVANHAGAYHLRERLNHANTLQEFDAYDRMVRRADPGIRRIDGFFRPVHIMQSNLIACNETSVGRREFIFDINLRGDHAKNGIGEYIGAKEAGNRYHEPETRAFVIVRSLDYEPDKTTAIIPPRESEEYLRATSIYNAFIETQEGVDSVQYVLGKVQGLRELRRGLREKPPIPLHAEIYPEVATAAD